MRLRHILWMLAALAVFVLVVAAAGAWRLSQGPVDLAFLAPRVEAALSRPQDGYRTELGSVEAAWAGWERLLRFRVTEARLFDIEGRTLVETEGLEFVLSAAALLAGRIVPKEVELLGIEAVLRRRSDGAIGLLAAPGTGTGTEDRQGEIDLLGVFAAGSANGGTGLARFGVRGAALTVVDDILGKEWSVPRLDLAFRDSARGPVAEGAASLLFAGTETDIDFTLALRGNAGGPSISARLYGLRPASAAEFHPLLAPLGYVSTPLSGTIAADMAPDRSLVSLGANLEGAGGAIADSRDPERSVPVDGLVVKARATDRLARLEIEAVEIKALGHTARLRGGGTREAGALSAFTHLEDVPPALLAPLLGPDLARAARTDTPVSGTVAWTFDAAFRPVALDAGLTLGAGTLQVSDAEAGPVAVRGGSALVQADLAAGQVLLEELSLDLERGRIEASGEGRRTESGWKIRLHGTATAVPVDDLRLLWPPGAGSPGARQWVLANLKGGRIDEAGVAVDGDIAFAPEFALRRLDVGGALSFSGVAARYWQPLPPFEDIAGSASFDGKAFSMALARGKHRGIRIEGAEVSFRGLDRADPPSRLSADVRFDGPLSHVLEVLDRKPLGYAGYLGLDPAAVKGGTAFRLRVGLPLLDALEIDDVEVEAEGSVSGAYLPNAVFETDLQRASLDIEVDKTRLAVSGKGALDGAPAAFELEIPFSKRDPIEAVYSLRTRIDDRARARLGFDLAPYVTGPVELDIAATDYRGKPGQYVVKAGLGPSEIDLGTIGWEKPAGEPAWLEASFRTGADGLLEASSLAAAGPGLELAGRGRFDIAGKKLLDGSLDRLRIGERTELSLQVEPASDGTVSIRASGPTIDLSAFFGGSGEDSGDGEGLGGLTVALNADRAWVGGDRPLHGFEGRVRLQDDRILEAAASARTRNDRAVLLSFVRNAEGSPMRVEAEDAGALLRALGWFDDMRGGTLRFNARAASGEDGGHDGRLVVKRFRVKDAPALARFLAAASLTGIGDALSSDAGLGFERLESPVKVRGNRIGLGPGRVFGNAIGVTFRGAFDRDRRTVSLIGVLVPAYYVSRVLRKIPLIGDLLTGGGEGLFAASYELSGPVDDPRTKVNPLTVLAPGFLRGLFGPLLGAEGRDWNPDEDPVTRSDP